MAKFKFCFFLTSLYIIVFVFPAVANAQDSNKFVTIVNPVRISTYNKNAGESLKSEYAVVRKRNLASTWLFTYDALSNNDITKIAKNMDENQEFGIFLEVTANFAKDGKVDYHDTGFWQHANSVFLSGYELVDRKKLIDTVFEKFKSIFGYYPKSVGSWWTDSFSLSYMRDKYGVIANLVCSDQYSTDGYQIWGQPWEVAYYPSKLYLSIPASDKESKLDVVNIQWAPRDPFNGYGSSLYSTQDYLVAWDKQDVSYFRKLVDLYLENGELNRFSQVTVGLEADLDPVGYKDEYAKQLDYIDDLKGKGINVVTMSGFSDWYRNKFSDTPDYKINSKDLLGQNVKSFWYGNTRYRLFYIKDDDKKELRILDLRIYNSILKDPYYYSPNFQFTLSENIPAVIDNVSNPNDLWILKGDIEIITENDGFGLTGRNINIPDFIKKSTLVSLKKINGGIKVLIGPGLVLEDGVNLKDFSSEALHFFKQKLAIFYLLIGSGWNYFKKVDYTIPQGEIYALMYLKSQPNGKVLVFDGECLQCSWHTRYKPPVFSNLRGYVSKYSGMPIVYNRSVFEAATQRKAKDKFDKLHVKYIYLVKFEDYIERLPFSPGDFGVERIFSNANAEIWRVK